MAQVGKRGQARGLRFARGRLVIVLAVSLAVLGISIALLMTLAKPGGVVLERSASTALSPATSGASAGEPAGQPDFAGDTGSAATSAVASTLPVSPSSVFVHVDGAVHVPGVYELPLPCRGSDAIVAAGGLAEDADTTGVNLALVLADGDKLYVPRKGEQLSATVPTAEDGAGTTSGNKAGDASGAGNGASGAGGQLVNINSASASELDSLPGVGPSTAAAIVEDRASNGPFASIEDLMRVSGIGEKKFEKLKGHICV